MPTSTPSTLPLFPQGEPGKAGERGVPGPPGAVVSISFWFLSLSCPCPIPISCRRDMRLQPIPRASGPPAPSPLPVLSSSAAHPPHHSPHGAKPREQSQLLLESLTPGQAHLSAMSVCLGQSTAQSEWEKGLFVSWTARRSNQSLLKGKKTPEYSLEGLMLRLKLQYSGYLMRRADSLEKTLIWGKIEGRRRIG